MASPRVVLITGANSGIGYETAKAFLQSTKPYHVLFGSRSIDKGNAALKALQDECPQASNKAELLLVDVTSDDSIDQAFKQIKKSPGRLDVLINNAGANFDIPHLRGECNLRESFTKAYDANVAGAHILTYTLAPLLLASDDPRLIFVSGLSAINQASRAYFPTPPQPAGWPKPTPEFEVIGYRASKVALNMLMLDWAHKLKADGVKVWAVLPGMLATNLGGMPEMAQAMGAGHPSAGGNVMLRVVEGEMDHLNGKLIDKNGEAEL
nr:hypothetical protein B0A51_01805 [Rachicladosporium sp. CCFEE 5018]